MGRFGFAAALISLAVGCNVTAQGTITDGMTGEAIVGMDENTPEGKGLNILFRAVTVSEDGKMEPNAAAGAMCMVKETRVAADGTYTVADLCSSATDYSIELSDKNLFLAETNSIAKGYDGAGPLDLKVWRAPKGTGLFKLKGTELSRVMSATDFRTDYIFKSEEKVQSPAEIKSVPIIEAGEYLLLSGEAASYDIIPLMNSGKRRLGKSAGSKSEWVDQQPWSYVGITFTTDTEFERVTATLNAEKVIEKTKGKQTAKYLSSDALSQGRYAIIKPGGKRGWIVDFGAKGENPG